MDSSLTTEKLLIKASEMELYDNLVRQLNKDFIRAGIAQEFHIEIKPKSLIRSLVAALYELITVDFEAYLNLLYVIDVPEKSVKALPEQRVDELAQSIAELILKREWQKVLFRQRHQK
tara:strand:- start:833 stop:1186 length:354 start_codon:yes stop_codon:yes gene_type:complete